MSSDSAPTLSMNASLSFVTSDPYSASLWETTTLSILFPRKLYEGAVGQTVDMILSPPLQGQGRILS